MSWIRNTLTLLVSTLITLLLIEALLRLFPVIEVSRAKPLSETSNAFDVSTIENTQLEHSSAWDFKNSVTRKTNNFGFFSDYDYNADFSGIIVIGDSFVEARQVKFDQTFHQIVAKEIGEPVYNIALSGAPLSQYEAYAAQACNQFSPSAFVIPIIANDFDESLYTTRQRDGFFHYDQNGNLMPTPYSISPLRALANRSSLVRYLYFHLSLGALISSNTASTISEHEVFERITDTFLINLLDSCIARNDIVFVVDANRYEKPDSSIYTSNPVELARMRYFIDKATNMGYRVISLQEPMISSYKQTNEKLEYSFDYHWNVKGHALVAETLLNSEFFSR